MDSRLFLVAIIGLLALVGSFWPAALLPAPRRLGTPSAMDRSTFANRVLLWCAEGFGTGRIPIAPGTMGSVVGVGWAVALIGLPHAWMWGLAVVFGAAVSVWLAGHAEGLLARSDPPSVVIDEIVAIPLVYLGWMMRVNAMNGGWSPAGHWNTGSTWLCLSLGFLAFRFFDVVKPWPVRQSQSLVGGWGVTIDDFLAAAYANLIWIPVSLSGWW